VTDAVDQRVAGTTPRRMALATVVQGLARFAQLSTLAVASALIARHEMASVLGTYGLAVLVLNLIQTCGDWGLTPIGAQALVDGEPGVSPGGLVRIRAMVQAPIAGLCVVATVIAWSTGHNDVATGLAAGAAAGVIGNLAASMMAPFQAAHRTEVPAWIDVGSRVAGLGMVILAIAAGAAGWVVVWTVPAMTLLDLLATAYAGHRRGFGVWEVDRSGAGRRLLRRATPLAVLNIFSVLYLRANSLVVLAVLGTASLGAYSLVFRVVDVLVLAPSLFLIVFFPVLVRLRSIDLAGYRGACQQAHDAFMAIGCALTLATILAAHPLIRLLGGGEYLGAVTPLRILAVAGLAGFANALFSQLMIIEGLQATILRVSVVALAVNLGLSVLLVHTDQLNGAATAAAISEILGAAMVIGIVSSRAKLGIRWRRSVLVVLGASAVTAAGLVAEHIGVSAIVTTVVGTMLFAGGWFGLQGQQARALLAHYVRQG